jgi:YVTN family beta-propeller protein
MLFIFFLYSALTLNCHSPVINEHIENDRLILVSKVILPGVSGRIDHISYDPETHLAFIAALGNNSVEVVNTNTERVVHTIKGLHEPQGILYISSIGKLAVANGRNGNCVFFDTKEFTQSDIVHLRYDADNIRYDADSRLLYVGAGSGGIAVIDVNTLKEVADITLDDHPESFQLSKKQQRIYINIPDANEIEIADLSTNKVITKWKNTDASSNFPMALDDKNNHLFIGYRSPATLRMIDTETGKDIVSSGCSGDADDIFYNADDSLVFVSSGKGFIDIFRFNEKELIRINKIETRNGARTSLLIASERKFLLAVPANAGSPAALWIYNIE